jgi:putative addiction module killer protein
MITITKTREFETWIGSLRDRRAAARIGVRLDRLAFGYFGDVKPVGGGISEIRIDHGPGYRVYFAQKETLRFCSFAAATKAVRRGTSAKQGTCSKTGAEDGPRNFALR